MTGEPFIIPVREKRVKNTSSRFRYRFASTEIHGFVFGLLVCFFVCGLNTRLLSITKGGWNPTKTVSFGAGALADPAGQFVLFAKMLPSSIVSEMLGPDTKIPVSIIPGRVAMAGSPPQRFAMSTPAEYAAFNSALQNISPSGSPAYDTKSIFCPLNFFRALTRDSLSVTFREVSQYSACHKALSRSSACSATAPTFSCASLAAFVAALDELRALPAAAFALSDFPIAIRAAVSAFSASEPAAFALSIACPDLSSATPALSTADLDFRSASSAVSRREPVSIPEILLVLTRQISSKTSATISSSVERFASLSLASLSSCVKRLVKSAMYSPAHATATKNAKTYSAISQQRSAADKDETSEVVEIMLATKKGTHCSHTPIAGGPCYTIRSFRFCMLAV